MEWSAQSPEDEVDDREVDEHGVPISLVAATHTSPAKMYQLNFHTDSESNGDASGEDDGPPDTSTTSLPPPGVHIGDGVDLNGEGVIFEGEMTDSTATIVADEEQSPLDEMNEQRDKPDAVEANVTSTSPVTHSNQQHHKSAARKSRRSRQSSNNNNNSKDGDADGKRIG